MANATLSPAEAHEILRRHVESWEGSGVPPPSHPRRPAWSVRTAAYARNEIIRPAPDRTGCLGLIVRGRVAAVPRPPGDKRQLAILAPGDTFGGPSERPDPVSGTTLRAISRCEVWFLCPAQPAAEPVSLRIRRRVPPVWYRIGLAAFFVAIVLVAVLVLGLPSSRAALAQIPMAVGQLCSQQGSDGCAEKAWQTAAALLPADPNPSLALGVLYAENGDLSAAERAFEAARLAAADSPEALNNLGVVYSRQGDYRRAVAAFGQAVALEPGAAVAQENLALSLQGLERHDEALVYHRSAAALADPQAALLANMAIAYYGAGQLDKAEEMARAALGYDEALAPAFTLLGAVALQLRQPEKALLFLQRAVELDAADPAAAYYLGVAYLALKQPAQAKTALQQALASADDERVRSQVQHYLDALQDAGAREASP